ncbi:30S ribosomal protein S2 [Candidatus Peregrinibacteria bacterium RIFCSPLOWO2_02_FULL_48_14]|nr:MAG: 30S ribosomal protein S2 [Candidatus Peregrinibacteria bacterium RIFCSPLOWO2_01_FULL_48_20]OGJ45800.1 MAG: 30S ribosomal protein S2 [Candidatus Peregrinibacteria bacterium RIFCSPLOWO2_02_FULL_48_14]
MSDQKTVMREMLANAVHFGHRTAKWNPKMAPYLYEKRNGVHIFDLNKTYQGLTSAMEFLEAATAQGKTVLFVSTKPQATRLLKEEAEKCGMPYVISKWIPGLLTNFKTIRSRVKYLLDLKAQKETGEFEKYTKKEASELNKQIEKLEKALGGVASLERVPDIVFVLDCVRDRIAVQEAIKVKTTVVAIVDSNADPDGIAYVIPANDDAIKSIQFLLSNLSMAVQNGVKKAKK